MFYGCFLSCNLCIANDKKGNWSDITKVLNKFLLNVFEIAMHMLYWYLDLQATLKVYWILEIAFSKWLCLPNTYHNKRQEWGPGQDFRNEIVKMVLFAKYMTHEKRQDWGPEQDGNNYLDCFYSKATPVPLYWFPTTRK